VPEIALRREDIVEPVSRQNMPKLYA